MYFFEKKDKNICKDEKKVVSLQTISEVEMYTLYLVGKNNQLNNLFINQLNQLKV